jgi:hypothetical protein
MICALKNNFLYLSNALLRLRFRTGEKLNSANVIPVVGDYYPARSSFPPGIGLEPGLGPG